jgi:death-on-curing protein
MERYGGEIGILNEGCIDYLIYLLENDVFKKASLALVRIITNHPFFDGQKRTAFQVADILLRHEDFHIHATNEEILPVLLKIAKYECPEEKIEKWLKRKSRPLKSC